MKQNAAKVSRPHPIKLYLFLSAFAVNLFLAVIITANNLSIQYFFYGQPTIIQIDFVSPIWNTLLWVGSFYLVYVTKDVVEDPPRSNRITLLLKVALVGSFVLISSVLVAATLPAESFAESFLRQLWSLTVSLAYIFSFAGSSLALVMIMARNRSILRLFLIYLFSLLIPVEVWALVHWLAYPFNVVEYLEFAWKGAFFELQMFYLTYPLIFSMLIAFLFSWIWMPLAKRARNKIEKKRTSLLTAFGFDEGSTPEPLKGIGFEKPSNHDETASQDLRAHDRIPAAILLVSLLLGAFVAYYPYINNRPGWIGNDTLGYYLTLTNMAVKDPYGAIQFASATDRPLYFLLLYLFKSLTQLSSGAIIVLMPIVTVLANAVSVFWFVKAGEKKPLTAAIAAVFSIFSFSTMIGMHAGIAANWFAFALGFVMLGLVLKLQERISLGLIIGVILTLLSILLIHYWSGVFFLLVLGCYVFLMFLERGRHNSKFVVAMILSASAIVILLFSSGIASQLFISAGSAENAGLSDVFALFWTKLSVLIDTWFFGSLANPLFILLSIIGIVICFNEGTKFGRLLISWTIVGSLLTIFLSPVGRNVDQWLLWRALYLIPFQIPAALGLFYFISRLRLSKKTQPEAGMSNASVQPTQSSYLTKQSMILLSLTAEYVVSAALLTLNFPILGALVLMNCLAITSIVHFEIREKDYSSVVVALFVVFVILLLFNHALRSVAPLTVHRMQP